MAGIGQSLKNISSFLRNLVVFEFRSKFPPHCYALAGVEPLPLVNSPNSSSYLPSILEKLKDSILWAVPKHRRSIFRRRIRRFGIPERWLKIRLPKTNLLICDECGGYREAGLLCPTCYEKVRVLTEEMQDKIQQELGLDPVDKEVVVLFEGDDKQSEFLEGKRIVEMKKERPPWFSKNLLQPSTQVPSKTTAVEPKDLA